MKRFETKDAICLNLESCVNDEKKKEHDFPDVCSTALLDATSDIQNRSSVEFLAPHKWNLDSVFLGFGRTLEKISSMLLRNKPCADHFVGMGSTFSSIVWSWKAFVDVAKSRLASPQFDAHRIWCTVFIAIDASNFYVYACLCHVVDGVEHSMCYLNRKTKMHERWCYSTEKEEMAMLLAEQTLSVCILRVFSCHWVYGSQPVWIP